MEWDAFGTLWKLNRGGRGLKNGLYKPFGRYLIVLQDDHSSSSGNITVSYPLKTLVLVRHKAIHRKSSNGCDNLPAVFGNTFIAAGPCQVLFR